MPKLALRLMIGDAEFRAIGHVAAQWAFLEDQIDCCLEILLAQPAAASLARRVPTAFSGRIRLLRECARAVLQTDALQADRLVRIADDAASLKGRRDEIIHGQWRLRRTRGGRLTTGIDHIRRQPTLRARQAIITADQAEAIAAKISEVHLRLILFLNESVRFAYDDSSEPPVDNSIAEEVRRQ
jgi:hypothetical protein